MVPALVRRAWVGHQHSARPYIPCASARARARVSAVKKTSSVAGEGRRKKTVQRLTTTGFAPPSQSDRLPQPQRCPEPGGQAGDQDCSRKLCAAPLAFSECGTPSCARTAAGARPKSSAANRTRSPLTRAILAGTGYGGCGNSPPRRSRYWAMDVRKAASGS